MKQIDLPFFIELGEAFTGLRRLKRDSPIADAFLPLFEFRRQLKLLQTNSSVALVTSRTSIQKFLEACERIEQKYYKDELGDFAFPDSSVKDSIALGGLISSAEQLRTVLFAELRTHSAFSVTQVGIFDVAALINSSRLALTDQARSSLPERSLDEFDSAGRCLAYSLPTACGFHAMRSVELAMGQFLLNFIDQERVAKLVAWGPRIEALEKVATEQAGRGPAPSREVLMLLRSIKDISRNPVIHPERTLDIAEANTLFHSVIAALNRVAIELKPSNPLLPGMLEHEFRSVNALTSTSEEDAVSSLVS